MSLPAHVRPAQLPGVVAGFTSRAGGISPDHYASLNLSYDVGDVPRFVMANRAILARWVGTPLAYAKQVHGRDVKVLTEVPKYAPRVDALVTATPGVGLAIQVADCVPVLLADAQSGVIGAAHAGRAGLVAGVVPAVVDTMTSLGARAISAVIGPAICGQCYEVPAEMAAEAEAVIPGARSVTQWGTAGIDIPGAVASQLSAVGIAWTWVAQCTFESADLFSHRRATTDGTAPTGRYAGFIATA